MFVRHEKACSQRLEVENWNKMFIALAEITGYSFLIEIQNTSGDTSLNFIFKV
jgi:hypothetical protein